VAVISHYWNTPELENEKSADDLTAELQTAVSALAHPDALTPEQRTAAAAPFEALESAAPPPQPSATGSAGCANQYSPAQPVAIAPLTYPVTALTTRSAGTILVKVTLSETGGVRSATLFKQTGDGAGSDALVDAAIISAAATTYRPDLERCVPSGGSYLFKADFILRK
jgi:outer membrane biosynthesis protein TonB